MTIKKSIFLILLSAFTFFNCSDEPTSIGDGIPGLGLINLITINSSDDSLVQTSSYEHPSEISLSASERLLLGKIGGEINASILIKFETALADSIEEDIRINEVTVKSSVVEFQKTYSFGDTLAPFDFTVHKVTSNWSVGFTKDSLQSLTFEGEDLSGEEEINDSLTSFPINSQVVLEWLRITADTSLSGNNGVYIKPAENTNQVLGYQALTSSFTDIPIIKVVIENTAEAYTDTITFISTLDLTVMDGSDPVVSSGNMPIRAGYIMNGKLFFDLSSLPEKAIVNKAELVLTLDTLETKVGTSYTNSLLAYFLFDSTNTDSINSSGVTLSRSGNNFSGNITAYARVWLENNNHGLLLTAGNPTGGVELFTIKGSDAVADKPLLKITYSIRE